MLSYYLIDPSNYEEECCIGKGNFSSVSLVHPKENKKVNIALKKIPVDLNDSDSQKFFMREVSIMSELNHPSLIKLIGFSFPSDSDQTFKIYSEYLPNKTLMDALKDDELSDTMTPTQKTIIIYGIASAMAYLHEKNIIHRDLKPENVFLDEHLYPVLSDFGLSRICNDDIAITTRVGTPYFMAPELFFEESEENPITNKIDVYAFSITLLSMFTTSYKFSGSQPRSINQLVNNIVKGKRYQIPSNVPKFYEDLIQKCWVKDQSKRPSFKEIVEMLENSKEFILDGADEIKVYDFIKKVKNTDTLNDDELIKSNNILDFSSSGDDIFADTEEFDFGGF